MFIIKNNYATQEFSMIYLNITTAFCYIITFQHIIQYPCYNQFDLTVYSPVMPLSNSIPISSNLLTNYLINTVAS